MKLLRTFILIHIKVIKINDIYFNICIVIIKIF